MKHLLLGCIICFVFRCYPAEAQSEKHLNIIHNFIALVQKNDVQAIAAAVKYPFQRKYPLAAILNKEEFVENYPLIFDDALRNKIINSSADKNWVAVNQYRITLENGLLWLDHKGRIKRINYLPKKAQKYYQKLLRQDRQKLHKSVQKYWEPVLSWTSDQYEIRIDKENPYSYRLTLLPSNKSLESSPSIIIEGGQKEYEGIRGHQLFIFRQDNKVYSCKITKTERNPEKMFLIQDQDAVNYSRIIP